MSLRVSGVGTLTRDVEIKKTAKGAWLSFGLATKRKMAQEGKQDVDFFEASYFLKNPDSPLPNYLKKGTPIYLENAEIRADQYEKEGQKKTFNKVMIFAFDLLNGKSDASSEPKEEIKPPSSLDQLRTITAGTLPPKDVPKTVTRKSTSKEPPIEIPTDPEEYTDEVPF